MHTLAIFQMQGNYTITIRGVTFQMQGRYTLENFQSERQVAEVLRGVIFSDARKSRFSQKMCATSTILQPDVTGKISQMQGQYTNLNNCITFHRP